MSSSGSSSFGTQLISAFSHADEWRSVLKRCIRTIFGCPILTCAVIESNNFEVTIRYALQGYNCTVPPDEHYIYYPIECDGIKYYFIGPKRSKRNVVQDVLGKKDIQTASEISKKFFQTQGLLDRTPPILAQPEINKLIKKYAEEKTSGHEDALFKAKQDLADLETDLRMTAEFSADMSKEHGQLLPEYRQLHQHCTSLTQEIQTLKDEKAELSKSYEDATNNLDKVKEAFHSAIEDEKKQEEILADKQKQLVELNIRVGNLEQELREARELYKNMASQRDEVQQKFNELQIEHLGIQTSWSRLEHAIEDNVILNEQLLYRDQIIAEKNQELKTIKDLLVSYRKDAKGKGQDETKAVFDLRVQIKQQEDKIGELKLAQKKQQAIYEKNEEATRQEKERLDNQQRLLDKELIETKEKAAAIEKKLTETTQAFSSLQRELSAVRQEKSTIEQALAEKTEKLALLQQENETIKQTIAALEDRLSEKSMTLGVLEQDIARVNEQVAIAEQNIALKKQELEALQQKHEQMTQRASTAEQDLALKSKAFELSQQELGVTRTRASTLEQQLSEENKRFEVFQQKSAASLAELNSKMKAEAEAKEKEKQAKLQAEQKTQELAQLLLTTQTTCTNTQKELSEAKTRAFNMAQQLAEKSRILESSQNENAMRLAELNSKIKAGADEKEQEKQARLKAEQKVQELTALLLNAQTKASHTEQELAKTKEEKVKEELQLQQTKKQYDEIHLFLQKIQEDMDGDEEKRSENSSQLVSIVDFETVAPKETKEFEGENGNGEVADEREPELDGFDQGHVDGDQESEGSDYDKDQDKQKEQHEDEKENANKDDDEPAAKRAKTGAATSFKKKKVADEEEKGTEEQDDHPNGKVRRWNKEDLELFESLPREQKNIVHEAIVGARAKADPLTRLKFARLFNFIDPVQIDADPEGEIKEDKVKQKGKKRKIEEGSVKLRNKTDESDDEATESDSETESQTTKKRKSEKVGTKEQKTDPNPKKRKRKSTKESGSEDVPARPAVLEDLKAKIYNVKGVCVFYDADLDLLDLAVKFLNATRSADEQLELIEFGKCCLILPEKQVKLMEMLDPFETLIVKQKSSDAAKRINPLLEPLLKHLDLSFDKLPKLQDSAEKDLNTKIKNIKPKLGFTTKKMGNCLKHGTGKEGKKVFYLYYDEEIGWFTINLPNYLLYVKAYNKAHKKTLLVPQAAAINPAETDQKQNEKDETDTDQMRAMETSVCDEHGKKLFKIQLYFPTPGGHKKNTPHKKENKQYLQETLARNARLRERQAKYFNFFLDACESKSESVKSQLEQLKKSKVHQLGSYPLKSAVKDGARKLIIKQIKASISSRRNREADDAHAEDFFRKGIYFEDLGFPAIKGYRIGFIEDYFHKHGLPGVCIASVGTRKSGNLYSFLVPTTKDRDKNQTIKLMKEKNKDVLTEVRTIWEKIFAPSKDVYTYDKLKAKKKTKKYPKIEQEFTRLFHRYEDTPHIAGKRNKAAAASEDAEDEESKSDANESDAERLSPEREMDESDDDPDTKKHAAKQDSGKDEKKSENPAKKANGINLFPLGLAAAASSRINGGVKDRPQTAVYPTAKPANGEVAKTAGAAASPSPQVN